MTLPTTPEPAMPGAPAPRPPGPHEKPENLLLNLACNVAIPTLILSKFSGAHTLGPKGGLIVALAFPVAYGVHDFVKRRKTNFISIIGFASILVSGGFGLLKVDGFWFAVKDAALPTLIGVAVLASMKTKSPLVESLLYNPQVIDVEKVDAALTAHGRQADFKRLLHQASQLLAASFFFCGALNYLLARHVLKSPPGTEAFNGELGRMHWLGVVVVTLPGMAVMMLALWRLMHGIKALTGLELDQVFRPPPEKKKG
jgi:hypothetical protein